MKVLNFGGAIKILVTGSWMREFLSIGRKEHRGEATHGGLGLVGWGYICARIRVMVRVK